MTTYYDANLIQAASRGTSPVAYTWVPYVSFSATLPGRDGSNVTECPDANWARQAFGGADDGTSHGILADAAQIVCPVLVGDYTYHYVLLYDAPTGGHLRRFGTVDLNRLIPAGEQAVFLVGALTDAVI